MTKDNFKVDFSDLKKTITDLIADKKVEVVPYADDKEPEKTLKDIDTEYQIYLQKSDIKKFLESLESIDTKTQVYIENRRCVINRSIRANLTQLPGSDDYIVLRFKMKAEGKE